MDWDSSFQESEMCSDRNIPGAAVEESWLNFVRDVPGLRKTVRKRRAALFVKPGKQQYALQSSAAPEQ